MKGASGTVRFTDLLSLTTAPDQRIAVASINPGIEVENGSVAFSLRDGQFLGVTGGTWPFMGGTLYLRPVELNLGIAERRRYLLEVEGLDAALFVEGPRTWQYRRDRRVRRRDARWCSTSGASAGSKADDWCRGHPGATFPMSAN